MPDDEQSTAADDRAPRLVGRAGRAVLGLGMISAAYLIWARGEAILADLAGLAAWCF